MKHVLTAFGAAAFAFAAPAAAQQFNPGMRSVKIEATSFERSAAFYTALGMKVGTKREATWDMVWEQPTQNSGIVMTTTAYAERAKMVRGGTYMMIITPDVGAVVAKLRAAGFPDVGEPKQMGTMVTYVILRDPDGNQIELMGPPAK